MRTLAWIGLVGLVAVTVLALGGTCSFALAYDHSAKTTVVVISTDSPTASVSSSAPVSCPVVVIEALKAIESEIPAPPVPRTHHFVVTGRPADHSHPVVRTTRAAITLGRAIRTAVEAVMGSLVTAAAEKTAEIV